MFCQLGKHSFQLAKTPNSISHREDFTFAEFALINQPNRLQPMGRGLREYTFGVFFHVEFCKVEDEIKSLRESARNFEVLPLLWGNGNVEGDFVITSIDTETRQADDLGNIYAATLQVELKEFISDPAKKQKQEATQKALAIGTKKNVVGKKANADTAKATPLAVPPCNSSITKARQRINALLIMLHNNHSKKDILQHTSGYDNAALQTVVRKLKGLADASDNEAYQLQSTSAACLTKYGLTNAVSVMKLNATTLLNYYGSNHALDPFGIVMGDQALSNYDNAAVFFINATQSVAAEAITRKP